MNNTEQKTKAAQASVVEPESRDLRDILLGRRKAKAVIVSENGERFPVMLKRLAKGTVTVRPDISKLFEQMKVQQVAERLSPVAAEVEEKTEPPAHAEAVEQDSGEAILQADQDAEMREGANRSQPEVTE